MCLIQWPSQLVLVVDEHLPHAADIVVQAGSPSLGLNNLLEERHGNLFQYSCLENAMDRSRVGYSQWGGST